MIRDHRPMQPRPRVLAVAQSADLGGAELALMRVAERLPELGFDVELATPAAWSATVLARHAAAFRRPQHPLPVGGLSPGAWPQALAAWPRARSLARRF